MPNRLAVSVTDHPSASTLFRISSPGAVGHTSSPWFPLGSLRAVPAGRELKCLIDHAFADAEVDALVAWCESVEQAIREHAEPGGLR